MNPRRKICRILLILVALLIKTVSYFPETVEKYYSRGLYPAIAKAQRFLLGWIPFSVGDILYILAIILAVRAIIHLIVKRKNKGAALAKGCRPALSKLFYGALLIYVCFNICWGLNYNRVTVTEQFELEQEIYEVPDLEKLVLLLKDSLNANEGRGRAGKPLSGSWEFTGPDGKQGEAMGRNKQTFREAVEAYQLAADRFPRLVYKIPSVKPTLFGYLCNYAGISGYYNPFTGEAQVNTTVPVFLQPFISCHEIGHQLGFGKEDEANFVGFLSASRANDPLLRYSAYFDMYSYAWRALYRRDSVAARTIQQTLKPGVKGDIIIVRNFYQRYEGPVDRWVTLLYGQFLKANEQPKGIRSYSEVVGMLIAYYRKQGMI